MGLISNMSVWITVERTKVSRKSVINRTLIIFEFTAPGTPQENSVVERKITTLIGRSTAMMLTAGFSQQDKRKFWCEVISTATKLDNIIVRKERTKPPYTLFYNDEPKYKKYMRSFGEMALIAISDGKKTRDKNWIQEVEQEYLLAMVMTMLATYTDL